VHHNLTIVQTGRQHWYSKDNVHASKANRIKQSIQTTHAGNTWYCSSFF